MVPAILCIFTMPPLMTLSGVVWQPITATMLIRLGPLLIPRHPAIRSRNRLVMTVEALGILLLATVMCRLTPARESHGSARNGTVVGRKIGRASCRERV